MLKDEDYRELAIVGLTANSEGRVFGTGSVKYEVLGKLDGDLHKTDGVDHWVLRYTSGGKPEIFTYITVRDFTWTREYKRTYAYVVKDENNVVLYKGDSEECVTKLVTSILKGSLTVLRNTSV